MSDTALAISQKPDKSNDPKYAIIQLSLRSQDTLCQFSCTLHSAAHNLSFLRYEKNLSTSATQEMKENEEKQEKRIGKNTIDDVQFVAPVILNMINEFRWNWAQTIFNENQQFSVWFEDDLLPYDYELTVLPSWWEKRFHCVPNEHKLIKLLTKYEIASAQVIELIDNPLLSCAHLDNLFTCGLSTDVTYLHTRINNCANGKPEILCEVTKPMHPLRCVFTDEIIKNTDTFFGVKYQGNETICLTINIYLRNPAIGHLHSIHEEIIGTLKYPLSDIFVSAYFLWKWPSSDTNVFYASYCRIKVQKNQIIFQIMPCVSTNPSKEKQIILVQKKLSAANTRSSTFKELTEVLEEKTSDLPILSKRLLMLHKTRQTIWKPVWYRQQSENPSTIGLKDFLLFRQL